MRRIGIFIGASRSSGGLFQYSFSLLRILKGIPDTELYGITIKNTESYAELRHAIPDEHILVLDETSSLKAFSSFVSNIGKILYRIGLPAPKGTIDGIAAENRLDIVIFPYPTSKAFPLKTRRIVVIHDMLHCSYPQFFRVSERIWRWVVYYGCAKKAEVLVCDSNFTRNDILRKYDLSGHNIFIVPLLTSYAVEHFQLEADRLDEVRRRYKLDFPFAFYPAQFWRHKNHDNLIKALHCALREWNIRMDLVLVGAKKEAYGTSMLLCEKLGLKNQVHYLGYIPDEDMPYIYRLSRMLVYPSLFDPTGTPIWEAFKLGVPVVASRVCAIPEQVGDAGLLVNPEDPQEIAEKMISFWNHSDTRQEYVERGYARARDHHTGELLKRWKQIIDEALLKGIDL